SALDGLQRLRRAVDAPTALRDYGLAEPDIDDAVPAILKAAPANNPRPVTADGVRGLLRAAWEGADPAMGAWAWSRHTGAPERR
ncbi:hypothetical protein ABT363_30725, partial [Streptomyces sp. NPDC000188]